MSGPELEAIYSYILHHQNTGNSVKHQQLLEAFVPPGEPGGKDPQGNSLQKALGFLDDIGLLERRNPYRVHPLAKPTFRLELLGRLREKELKGDPQEPANRFYLGYVTKLFIEQDRFFVGDMHGEANALAGGVFHPDTTHLNDWGRVMSFLGLGSRVEVKGRVAFYCLIGAEVLEELLSTWDRSEGTLDQFFREHWTQYLAYANADNQLSRVVQAGLEYLRDCGRVELVPTQPDLSVGAYRVGRGSYQSLRRCPA